MNLTLCRIVVVVTFVGISGCGARGWVIPETSQHYDSPKHVAVFLDGTSNHLGHQTNVGRLYELTNGQHRSDIVASYAEGVGSKGRLLGTATAWGAGDDVRRAYHFIASNFEPELDDLYIFGFSRGAYSARVLAGFLYIAGLPDFNELASEREERALVDALYRAYKGDKSIEQRRSDVADVYARRRWAAVIRRDDIRISAIGLWDTVESFGVPNYAVVVDKVNSRYLDQICNIDLVRHAVALDDNRARIYTPILISAPHVNEPCNVVNIDDRVKEVWFNGAHADVGRGYRRGEIGSVSYDWMLAELSATGLLPGDACERSNPLGHIHNAESDTLGFRQLFRLITRDPLGYYGAYAGRLTIHDSVVERLAVINDLATSCDTNIDCPYDSRWYFPLVTVGCLQPTSNGYELVGTCVDVVRTSRPVPPPQRCVESRLAAPH